jgi:hypothetical protein
MPRVRHVYTVWWVNGLDYDDFRREQVGVFSTQKRAQAAAKKYWEAEPGYHGWGSFSQVYQVVLDHPEISRSVYYVDRFGEGRDVCPICGRAFTGEKCEQNHRPEVYP